MIKNTKGITLIALVVTIIILIILSGITILTLNQNRLFGRAEEAKEKNNKAQVDEQIKLAILDWQAEKTAGNKNIIEYLEESKVIDNYKDLEDETYQLEKDGYVIIIDKNGEIRKEISEINKEEDKEIKELKQGIVDCWNLKTSLTNKINPGTGDLIIAKGNDVTYSKKGVCLENTYLSTKSNYTFSDNYTMVIQFSELSQETKGYGTPIIGTGYTDANVGSYFSGVERIKDGRFWIMNGRGDSEGKKVKPTYDNSLQNIFVITFDGNEMKCFLNGTLIATCSGVSNKNTPLYIGGIPTNRSDLFDECRQKGYYKNVIIYNRALTDEEINKIDKICD